MTDKEVAVCHRIVTPAQWLEARGLTRVAYDGPMYLVACQRVIFEGETTSPIWSGVTCPHCLEHRRLANATNSGKVLSPMTTLTPRQVLAIAHCKSLSEVKRIAAQMNMDCDEAIRVFTEMEMHWEGEDPPSKYKREEGEGAK